MKGFCGDGEDSRLQTWRGVVLTSTKWPKKKKDKYGPQLCSVTHREVSDWEEAGGSRGGCGKGGGGGGGRGTRKNEEPKDFCPLSLVLGGGGKGKFVPHWVKGFQKEGVIVVITGKCCEGVISCVGGFPQGGRKKKKKSPVQFDVRGGGGGGGKRA